jgi:hypothetical protein
MWLSRMTMTARHSPAKRSSWKALASLAMRVGLRKSSTARMKATVMAMQTQGVRPGVSRRSQRGRR